MSIFGQKEPIPTIHVDETFGEFEKNIEIKQLKKDISLLLDVVLCDKKLTESDWLHLLQNHEELFFQKISMNKIREIVDMEEVESESLEN